MSQNGTKDRRTDPQITGSNDQPNKLLGSSGYHVTTVLEGEEMSWW
jgi:hypothetical protein